MVRIFSKQKQITITKGTTVNDPSVFGNLNHEYLVIQNSKQASFFLDNWQVSCNADGLYKYLYRFPGKINGKKWWFNQGELIFLFSGNGTDKYIADTDSNIPQFHFYMKSKRFLWNLPGAEAILWDSNTRKISTFSDFLFQNQIRQPRV